MTNRREIYDSEIATDSTCGNYTRKNPHTRSSVFAFESVEYVIKTKCCILSVRWLCSQFRTVKHAP